MGAGRQVKRVKFCLVNDAKNRIITATGTITYGLIVPVGTFAT
jgi:hypothetical protein